MTFLCDLITRSVYPPGRQDEMDLNMKGSNLHEIVDYGLKRASDYVNGA